MGRIYDGSVGVTFLVDTKMDLTHATVTQINVKPPSGNEMQWNASISGTATAGILSYTTSSGELAEHGVYNIQAYVELDDGSVYWGESTTLEIYNQYNGA